MNNNEKYIEVSIKKGRNLPAKDLNGKSDPYCKVSIFNKGTKRTPVKKKTLNPSWYYGATFTEKCELSKEQLLKAEKVVVIDIYDKDKMKKDDFMGRVIIAGEQVCKGEAIWYPLKPREGKKDKKVKGDLLVECTFVDPNLSEETLKELMEVSKFQSEKIKSLWNDTKNKTKGTGQIKSKKELRELLSVIKDDNKSLIDTILRQWDISGKNYIYQVKNDEFRSNMKEDTKVKDYIVDCLWNALDANNDGKISFKELVIGLNYICRGTPKERAAFQFKVMDKDNSGTLSRQELAELNKFRAHAMRVHFELRFPAAAAPLKQAGVSSTKIEKIKKEIIQKLYMTPKVINVGVELCFQYADKDSDGSISLEEYVDWATNEEQINKFVVQVDAIMLPIVGEIAVNAQKYVTKIIMQTIRGY